MMLQSRAGTLLLLLLQLLLCGVSGRLDACMFSATSLLLQRILYVLFGLSWYILSAVSGMLHREILEQQSRGDLLFSVLGGSLLSFSITTGASWSGTTLCLTGLFFMLHISHLDLVIAFFLYL